MPNFVITVCDFLFGADVYSIMKAHNHTIRRLNSRAEVLDAHRDSIASQIEALYDRQEAIQKEQSAITKVTSKLKEIWE